LALGHFAARLDPALITGVYVEKTARVIGRQADLRRVAPAAVDMHREAPP
jgi:hypothetical protein